MFGLCGAMDTMCKFFIPRVLMISLLEPNVAVAVKTIIGVPAGNKLQASCRRENSFLKQDPL